MTDYNTQALNSFQAQFDRDSAHSDAYWDEVNAICEDECIDLRGGTGFYPSYIQTLIPTMDEAEIEEIAEASKAYGKADLEPEAFEAIGKLLLDFMWRKAMEESEDRAQRKIAADNEY